MTAAGGLARESHAASASSAVAFGDLLEQLRRHGFPIGLDHYLRVQVLLETLGGNAGPERLKTLLAPILATNAEEQARFYRTFDQLYPLFAQAETPLERLTSEHSLPALTIPRRRRWPWLAGLLLVAGLAAAFVLREIRTSPQAPAVAPGPPPPASSVPRAQVGPQHPPPTPPEPYVVRHRRGLLLLSILGPSLLFALAEWRQYRYRRLVLQRERREKPPFTWPLRVEAPDGPYSGDPEVLAAARLLRERELGEVIRLDPERTIAATIAARGFPTLRYRSDFRIPEYLLLIERVGFRDHLANLFNDLGATLEREGVHVARFLFDNDPRICHPVSGEAVISLAELRHRHPQHRLIIAGAGSGMIDPISGGLASWVTEVASWPDRGLLSTSVPELWGAQEIALANHFMVLPASVAGMQAMIDHFRSRVPPNLRRWRNESGDLPLPSLEGPGTIGRLRAYLGNPTFKWLCATAVYPELHWNVTLHLAGLQPLGGGLVNETNLTRLARIPWFRSGWIPEELRVELIAELDHDTEKAVRQSIVELLEANPAPSASAAASRYELDLVVQRLALSRGNRKRQRALLRELRTLPSAQIVKDFALLRLLEDAPAKQLAMVLPRRLRKVFYRDGVAPFGLRTGVRAGLTLALATVAATFVLQASRPRLFPQLIARAPAGDSLRFSPPVSAPAVSTASNDTSRRGLPALPNRAVAAVPTTPQPSPARAESIPAMPLGVRTPSPGVADSSRVTTRFVSLMIVPSKLSPMGPEEMQQLGVMARTREGLDTLIRASEVKWTSSNGVVVTVGPGYQFTKGLPVLTGAGEIRTHLVGSATVTAALGGLRAQVDVRVVLRNQPAPAPTAEGVRATVAEYARAIESRDIAAVRRLYPGLTSQQQSGLERFFASVRRISVTFSATGLEVSGESAKAQLVGTYDYVDSNGIPNSQPVSAAATFRHDGSAWLIVSVR